MHFDTNLILVLQYAFYASSKFSQHFTPGFKFSHHPRDTFEVKCQYYRCNCTGTSHNFCIRTTHQQDECCELVLRQACAQCRVSDLWLVNSDPSWPPIRWNRHRLIALPRSHIAIKITKNFRKDQSEGAICNIVACSGRIRDFCWKLRISSIIYILGMFSSYGVGCCVDWLSKWIFGIILELKGLPI